MQYYNFFEGREAWKLERARMETAVAIIDQDNFYYCKIDFM
jgi:hypothetical protein